MKTNNKYKSVIGKVLPLAVGLCLTAAAAAQSSNIRQDSEEVQVSNGDTFQTIILIDADAEPITVVDVHMNFDPDFLEVESVVLLDESLFNYHYAPSFDNAEGKIDLAGFRFGNDMLDGEYSLVEVTFRALAPTEFTQISHEVNDFPQSLLAYAGDNRLGNASSTTVVIEEGQSTGVDDLSAVKGEVAIWPNPASDMAQLKFIAALSGSATIDIYDNSGKWVKSIYSGSLVEGSDYKFEIDVRDMASGMYNCALRIGSHSHNQSIVVSK